jgi:hypothetical protein
MTYLVMQQKEAEEKLRQADEELEKWRPRVEFAKRKGALDLAEEATRRVDSALAERQAAQFELERIANEKSMLRLGSRLPQGVEAANTEILLESFRAMGINENDGALDRLEKEQAGEDMLAALKAKMSKG